MSNPRWHVRRPTWNRHPAVRSGSQLTLGERSADRLRSGMGSWGFVVRRPSPPPWRLSLMALLVALGLVQRHRST